MSGILRIARCPVHGLHGERTECFVCGGPVEQVEMVPLREAEPMRITVVRVVSPDPAHPVSMKWAAPTDEINPVMVEQLTEDEFRERCNLIGMDSSAPIPVLLEQFNDGFLRGQDKDPGA